jgi:hypothetical protein
MTRFSMLFCTHFKYYLGISKNFKAERSESGSKQVVKETTNRQTNQFL